MITRTTGATDEQIEAVVEAVTAWEWEGDKSDEFREARVTQSRETAMVVARALVSPDQVIVSRADLQAVLATYLHERPQAVNDRLWDALGEDE